MAVNTDAGEAVPAVRTQPLPSHRAVLTGVVVVLLLLTELLWMGVIGVATYLLVK